MKNETLTHGTLAAPIYLATLPAQGANGPESHGQPRVRHPPRVFEDRFQDHSTSHTHIRNLQFAPCRGYHIRDFSISIKSLAWLWGSSGGLGHMYYGLQFDNLGCITVRSKQMARRVARCTLPHGLPVMS